MCLENHNGGPKERAKIKTSLKHQLGARSDPFLPSTVLNQAVILPHAKYLQAKKSLAEESPLSSRPEQDFGFT